MLAKIDVPRAVVVSLRLGRRRMSLRLRAPAAMRRVPSTSAEAALAQQNSATAQLDLQVVSAILNAHATNAAGLGELDDLQREVESAVVGRANPVLPRRGTRTSAPSHGADPRDHDGGAIVEPGRHVRGCAGGRAGIALSEDDIGRGLAKS